MPDAFAKVEEDITELRGQIRQLQGKDDDFSKQERFALQQQLAALQRQLAALREKEVLLMQSQGARQHEEHPVLEGWRKPSGRVEGVTGVMSYIILLATLVSSFLWPLWTGYFDEDYKQNMAYIDQYNSITTCGVNTCAMVALVLGYHKLATQLVPTVHFALFYCVNSIGDVCATMISLFAKHWRKIAWLLLGGGFVTVVVVLVVVLSVRRGGDFNPRVAKQVTP